MTQPANLDKIHEAVQLLQNHRFAEAEPIFNELLSVNPNDASANHFLGMLHTQTGRMQSGLALMKRSVELSPNFAEHRVNYAEAFFASGDVNTAIAECRQAISLDSNTAWAYYSLGRYLHARGQHSVAAEALLEAMRRLPVQPEPLELLIRCLMESGQTELAIGFSDDLVHRFPNHAAAPLIRQACLQAGKPDSPKPHFTSPVQSAQAQYDLGLFLDALHRYDPAAAAYTASVSLDPNHARSWANLAAIRFKQGLVDEAMRCYAQATQADPTLPASYCNEMFVRWSSPRHTPRETFEFHRNWARQHADSLTPLNPVFSEFSRSEPPPENWICRLHVLRSRRWHVSRSDSLSSRSFRF